MSYRHCVWIIALVCFSPAEAFGGGGEIFVTSTGECSSRNALRSVPGNANPEFPAYVMSPTQLISEYKKYLTAEVSSPYSAILNQGALRFCSADARGTVFNFLLDELKGERPPRRLWEVLLQQSRSAQLRKLVEERLIRNANSKEHPKLLLLHKQILRYAEMQSLPDNVDLSFLKATPSRPDESK